MSIDLILALVGLVLIVLSVRIVREQERLVILRFGRVIGIRGPGLVWILPFVDKATRITLDRDVPNWQSLSPEQLAKEIERLLTSSGPWRGTGGPPK